MTYGSMDGLITLEGRVVAATEKAIGVDFGFEDDRLTWLPKSQIEDWPEVAEFGEVILPEWLAKEKGLI